MVFGGAGADCRRGSGTKAGTGRARRGTAGALRRLQDVQGGRRSRVALGRLGGSGRPARRVGQGIGKHARRKTGGRMASGQKGRGRFF